MLCPGAEGEPGGKALLVIGQARGSRGSAFPAAARHRATNLVPPASSVLQTNIPGLPDTTSFTDTSPPLSSPAFCRIGVQAYRVSAARRALGPG